MENINFKSFIADGKEKGVSTDDIIARYATAQEEGHTFIEDSARYSDLYNHWASQGADEERIHERFDTLTANGFTLDPEPEPEPIKPVDPLYSKSKEDFDTARNTFKVSKNLPVDKFQLIEHYQTLDNIEYVEDTVLDRAAVDFPRLSGSDVASYDTALRELYDKEMFRVDEEIDKRAKVIERPDEMDLFLFPATLAAHSTQAFVEQAYKGGVDVALGLRGEHYLQLSSLAKRIPYTKGKLEQLQDAWLAHKSTSKSTLFDEEVKSVQEYKKISRDIFEGEEHSPFMQTLDTVMTFGTDAALGAISSAPQMAAIAANPIVGLTLISLQSMNNEFMDMYDAGVDEDIAYKVSTISGGVGGGLEFVQDALLNKLVGGKGGKVFDKVAPQIRNKAVRALGNIAGGVLGENITELGQLGIETFGYNVAIKLHNERNNTNLPLRDITRSDILETVRQTTATTLLLGTAGFTGRHFVEAKQTKEGVEAFKEATVQKLVSLGLDSVEVREKIDAVETAKEFNAALDTLGQTIEDTGVNPVAFVAPEGGESVVDRVSGWLYDYATRSSRALQLKKAVKSGPEAMSALIDTIGASKTVKDIKYDLVGILERVENADFKALVNYMVAPEGHADQKRVENVRALGAQPLTDGQFNSLSKNEQLLSDLAAFNSVDTATMISAANGDVADQQAYNNRVKTINASKDLKRGEATDTQKKNLSQVVSVTSGLTPDEIEVSLRVLGVRDFSKAIKDTADYQDAYRLPEESNKVTQWIDQVMGWYNVGDRVEFISPKFRQRVRDYEFTSTQIHNKLSNTDSYRFALGVSNYIAHTDQQIKRLEFKGLSLTEKKELKRLIKLKRISESESIELDKLRYRGLSKADKSELTDFEHVKGTYESFIDSWESISSEGVKPEADALQLLTRIIDKIDDKARYGFPDIEYKNPQVIDQLVLDIISTISDTGFTTIPKVYSTQTKELQTEKTKEDLFSIYSKLIRKESREQSEELFFGLDADGKVKDIDSLLGFDEYANTITDVDGKEIRPAMDTRAYDIQEELKDITPQEKMRLHNTITQMMGDQRGTGDWIQKATWWYRFLNLPKVSKITTAIKQTGDTFKIPFAMKTVGMPLADSFKSLAKAIKAETAKALGRKGATILDIGNDVLDAKALGIDRISVDVEYGEAVRDWGKYVSAMVRDAKLLKDKEGLASFEAVKFVFQDIGMGAVRAADTLMKNIMVDTAVQQIVRNGAGNQEFINEVQKRTGWEYSRVEAAVNRLEKAVEDSTSPDEIEALLTEQEIEDLKASKEEELTTKYLSEMSKEDPMVVAEMSKPVEEDVGGLYTGLEEDTKARRMSQAMSGIARQKAMSDLEGYQYTQEDLINASSDSVMLLRVITDQIHPNSTLDRPALYQGRLKLFMFLKSFAHKAKARVVKLALENIKESLYNTQYGVAATKRLKSLDEEIEVLRGIVDEGGPTEQYNRSRLREANSLRSNLEAVRGDAAIKSKKARAKGVSLVAQGIGYGIVGDSLVDVAVRTLQALADDDRDDVAFTEVLMSEVLDRLAGLMTPVLSMGALIEDPNYRSVNQVFGEVFNIIIPDFLRIDKLFNDKKAEYFIKNLPYSDVSGALVPGAK